VEEMAFCAMYVKSSEIKEPFLGIAMLRDTTGEGYSCGASHMSNGLLISFPW
jgi:hypothetical protein